MSSLTIADTYRDAIENFYNYLQTLEYYEPEDNEEHKAIVSLLKIVATTDVTPEIVAAVASLIFEIDDMELGKYLRVLLEEYHNALVEDRNIRRALS